MSDLLGHWAVFDDTRRLATVDERIDRFFVEILHENESEARLGAISRGGGWWVYRILERLRNAPEAALGSDPAAVAIRRRLAFALGGIIHYPADLFVKPVLGRLTAAGSSKRLVSAYFDVEVFREVYLSGQEGPFSQFLLMNSLPEPAAALESFVRALFQRALLSSHTLAPPRDDFEGWLDSLFGKVQPLYVDLQVYGRVWERPDPAEYERFEVATTFYRKDDPIVRLARRLARHEPISASELESALDPEANNGCYGRAVAMAVDLLRRVSLWWNDDSNPLPTVIQ